MISASVIATAGEATHVGDDATRARRAQRAVEPPRLASSCGATSGWCSCRSSTRPMACCVGTARALSNQYLRKTLVEGWWGVTSFFFNFFAVYTDVVALRKSTKLEPPAGSNPASPTPSTNQQEQIAAPRQLEDLHPE